MSLVVLLTGTSAAAAAETELNRDSIIFEAGPDRVHASMLVHHAVETTMAHLRKLLAEPVFPVKQFEFG